MIVRTLISNVKSINWPKIKILSAVIVVLLISVLFPKGVAAAFNVKAETVQPDADTVVKLEWSPVPQAAYYYIYRDGRQIKTINIDIDRDYLLHIDDWLKPETVYEYKVVALDSGRNKIDEAETKISTGRMRSPSDVTIDYNLISKTVTLKWKVNSKAAVRTIIKRNDGKEIAQISASVTSHTFYDKDLDANSSFQYTVISADSYGNRSEPSEPAILKAVDVPIISASIKNGVVTITWNEDADVANYYLERSKHNGVTWGSWQTVSTRLTKERTSIIDSPETGGTYRYRLNNGGSGGYTAYSNISEPVTKPVAPKDITCYINTDGSVTIRWINDQSNLSDLKVQRKSGDGEYIDIASLRNLSTSYTDRSVSGAIKEYTYRIVAWEANNNFNASDGVSVYMGRPAPPSGLSITVVSDNILILEWEDNSNNESGFKLERKTDNGEYVDIAVLPANETTHIDTVVPRGHVYSYRVKSYNPYGDSLGYSNSVSVNAGTTVISPDSLIATPVSSTRIDLTLTYPGYGGYNTILERKKAVIDKDGTEGKWEKVATLVSGDTQYSDTGLEPDSLYYYRARATMGAYLYSSPYPGGDTGIGVYTKLNEPTGLSATVISSNKIQLNWTDNSDETEFVIERKTGEGNYLVAAYVFENQTAWIDTSVAPDTKYTYRVKALTDHNDSLYSEEVTVISTLLEAPSQLVADVTSQSEVRLAWKDNSSNETGFELWRKKGETGEWVMIRRLGRNTESAVDTSVEADTVYYYKLVAYSRTLLGEVRSALSEEVKVRVSTPEPPSNLDYYIISSDCILLQWNENSQEGVEYEVQRKTGEAGQWETIGRLSSGTNSFTDNDIEAYMLYSYRVKAYNSEYKSEALSETIEVVTGKPKPPTDLTVTVLSPKMVDLEWKDNSDNELGFIIERRTYFGGYVVVGEVNENVTSYTDRGLLPNTRYYYRVKAYNRSGESEYTQEFYVRTKETVTFEDIKELYWAKDAIEDLAGRGIIKGKTDKLFAPGDTISRAEFTTLVIRALGLSGVPIGNFSDVFVNHWAYSEIMIAKSHGIVSGDEDNMFYPDRAIAREEMAVIVVKATMAINKPLPWYDISILDKYVDRNSISEEALVSMACLNGSGILNGRTEYTIDPKDNSTRAEAAVLLHKVLQQVER